MSSASAALKSYDISWIGANNYSLSGQFTFDDATAGTAVDQTELTSFFIEGFLNGTSLGTYSGPVYNFNFDTVTGTLGGEYRGASNSRDGQIWNSSIGGSTVSGIGFGSGLYAQILYLNGVSFLGSRIELEDTGSRLTATPSAVPLPAAAWMFIAGLAALMGGKWRLKRKMPALVAA
jgi:hypothetical protein